MDNAELVSLERGIRSLLAELGLDWVRANIEEGIAAGVRKEVLVRGGQHPNEPTSLFDEDEFRYAEPLSAKGGQRMIGNLRLSPAERMGLITQALRRIIMELPPPAGWHGCRFPLARHHRTRDGTGKPVTEL